jgi:hypothetical protein
MSKRKRSRAGEQVCRCGSYGFPHRFSGGACSCTKWVTRFFDSTRSECRDCINRDGKDCQVVDGREAEFHCPELRDFVRFEGIKLFGAARRSFDRSTRSQA